MEGRRFQFCCCKCGWSKTSRSEEAFSSHLNDHVKEEQKNIQKKKCHWLAHNGGSLCDFDYDEQYAKWLTRNGYMSGKRSKYPIFTLAFLKLWVGFFRPLNYKDRFELVHTIFEFEP